MTQQDWGMFLFMADGTSLCTKGGHSPKLKLTPHGIYSLTNEHGSPNMTSISQKKNVPSEEWVGLGVSSEYHKPSWVLPLAIGPAKSTRAWRAVARCLDVACLHAIRICIYTAHAYCNIVYIYIYIYIYSYWGGGCHIYIYMLIHKCIYIHIYV